MFDTILMNNGPFSFSDSIFTHGQKHVIRCIKFGVFGYINGRSFRENQRKLTPQRFAIETDNLRKRYICQIRSVRMYETTTDNCITCIYWNYAAYCLRHFTLLISRSVSRVTFNWCFISMTWNCHYMASLRVIWMKF
jgi:hypothetical protein